MIKRVRTGFAILLLAPGLCFSESTSKIAGGVVQSDEWVVRRDKQEEEFLGHVRFDRARDHLQADWALYQKTLDLWRVKGNLHGRRETPKGETWNVWADEGEYQMKSRDARLRGTRSRLRFERSFLHKGAAAVWHGAAQEAVLDGAKREVRLSGDVTLDGDDILLRSREAVYDQDTREGAFQGGRPVARFAGEKYIGARQADTLTLDESPRRVAATGSVRGWFTLHKPHGT